MKTSGWEQERLWEWVVGLGCRIVVVANSVGGSGGFAFAGFASFGYSEDLAVGS